MVKETQAIDKIKKITKEIYTDIKAEKQPEIEMPLRSLKNVTYEEKVGFFELLGKMKTRTLTASTAKTFAQTLKVMNLSKDLINDADTATKRETYYFSKGWGDAKFSEQPESDTVIDDIEAMLQINREQMGFTPEEKGGDIAGDLIVIDKDPETEEKIEIDCKRMGTGSYSIPSSVEHLQFKTSAKYIIAIETSGMFQRLVNQKYWKKHNCILVSMGGVPTRACRRFIRRLSDDKKLPVYGFTDGDPYGYGNIYRTLKVGSGNAAHINKYFCVPNAKFIGVTPEDIQKYDLPTHPLKDIDIKKIKDLIKNDPFIKTHKEWQKQLTLLAKLGKRVEQQALAKHGLNFVATDYLPEKISKKEFLP